MCRRKRTRPEPKKSKKKVTAAVGSRDMKSVVLPQERKGTAPPMTEEETANLFLSDLTTSSGNAQVSNNESTRDVRIKKGKKKDENKNKKKKTEELVGVVPLEDGEEDPAVAAEVLRQTAEFLARLTPARSEQFWALRRVARGELDGRSAANFAATMSTEDEEDDVTSSDGGSHEGSSSAELEEEYDFATLDGEDEMEDDGGEVGKGTVQENGKCVAGAKRSRGGALFRSNPDVWDD